jgi:hypothetical protein
MDGKFVLPFLQNDQLRQLKIREFVSNIFMIWVSWILVENTEVVIVDVYLQGLGSLVVEEASSECLNMGVPTFKQHDIFLHLAK